MNMKVMMKMTTISIFMLLVSCVVNVNVIHSVDVNVDSAPPPPPPAAVRLELIHRDSPKLHGENDEIRSDHHHDQRQRWKELHRRDSLRHHNLLYSRRRRDQEKESESESDSFDMPMNSGADYRNGEYFVHVKVGTPAQKVTLVADTASDLTWVNCKHGCGRNCSISKGKLSSKRAFRADHSSTFQVIPCSSHMCKSDLSDLFSLQRCPTPFTPCTYDYRYMQGSAAIGFFANETISVGVTNGKKGELHNVLIGCTKSIENVVGVRGADGILGLGYGNYTFTTNAAAEFGGKFSYCLVDHLSHENVSNYLIFGDNSGSENTLSSSKRYTKLVLGGKLRTYYGLNVLGISIGGILLKIPSFVWDENRGGGTILDSGSSLTYLALPAYEPVMDALEKSVSKYERFSGDQGGPFEYCFNSTGFDEALVPRLAIHFVDGARFEPPVKSYIIDTADQEKCIGFVPVVWPANSIIGNIMQQNHLWEFDLVGRTLGFAPSSCT